MLTGHAPLLHHTSHPFWVLSLLSLLSRSGAPITATWSPKVKVLDPPKDENVVGKLEAFLPVYLVNYTFFTL